MNDRTISRRNFLAAGALSAGFLLARTGRASTSLAFSAAAGSADATPAARAAAKACRGQAGAILSIPFGEYHFADPPAIRDMENLLAAGKSRDLAWGGNNDPFQLAFDFIDCDDLIFDGNGSTLVFHGLIAPFSFRNCRSVTLKNFTLDWDRPLFTTGYVERVKSLGPLSYADFQPAVGFPLSGGEPAFAWQAFDPVTLDFSALEAYFPMPPLKKVDGGLFRLAHPLAARLKKGDGLMVRHVGMFRPGIHLFESESIRIEDVTMRANPGIGVIGHRSRDIAISRLTVAPRPGRVMTCNTDALHFISCRGQVTVEDSSCRGMGDDGINVHNFYQVVKQRINDRTLLLTVPAATQDCMFDHPDAGDRLEICRRDTLVGYAEVAVESAEPSQEQWEVTVRLDRPLPADFRPTDIFANVSQLPRLTYRGNRVGANRARAVLCQTRGALIENNEFIRCTGTGVHVNTAAGMPRSWWESAGTRDVVIRGNRIIGCGSGPGCYHGASGVTVGAESIREDAGVHRNLTIESNEIECAAKRSGIYLSAVTGVRLTGNKITGGEPAIVVRKSVVGIQRD